MLPCQACRSELEDICAERRSAAIKVAHFQAIGPGKCASDAAHGKLAASDRGHFISLKRSKLLATTQKNLTVHNADSYRWYCSYFFKDAINVGAQALNLPQPPW